ncbi:MAG TPA: FtsX-like permease family protein [Alphaproteobacteria bacterium]|nr:FtsX-like permease family protein [Alphaproteobacteria bacterium]
MRIPLQPETRAVRALSLVVIALMVALGIAVLAGAAALRHVDVEWRQALTGRWTVELEPADPTRPVAQADIDRAVLALKAVVGVIDARAVPQSDIKRLLQPWLRNDSLITELPLPALIDIRVDTNTTEPLPALAQKIAAQVPGAKLDDHGAWTRDLMRLAKTGEALGLIMFAAIALVSVFTVAATARARLTINRPEIELLHRLGASDGYIARQFQTGAFQSSAVGALLGSIVAGGGLAILMTLGRAQAPLIPRLRLEGFDWIVLAAVPIGAVLLATFVARWTAHALARRLP